MKKSWKDNNTLLKESYWQCDDECVIKYYVLKGDEGAGSAPEFNDSKSAVDYAIKIGADEVEKHIWDSEETYNNYEPSDSQEVIWRKED